jgi:hypothetical protein
VNKAALCRRLLIKCGFNQVFYDHFDIVKNLKPNCMKMTKVGLSAFVALAVGALAFNSFDGGSISGKVTPVDGATEVWAISGTDTLKAPVTDGAFSVQPAKAGTYTVIVDAKDPYKDATLQDVKVEDGKATDLGEIKLD